MSTYREYTVAELQRLVDTQGYVRYRTQPAGLRELLIRFTRDDFGEAHYQAIDNDGVHANFAVGNLHHWETRYYAPATEDEWLVAELVGACRLEDDDATQAQ